MESQTFASTKTDSLALNEKNDCAVKAIAITHNVEYTVVHKLLHAEGRVNRTGTYNHQQKAVSKKLGATFIETIPRKAGGRYISVATIGKYFPIGRHMVFVRGHVLALVNGKVEDWTQGRKHRVLNVWTITLPETETKPVVKPVPTISPTPNPLKAVKIPKPGTNAAKVWEITSKFIAQHKTINRDIIIAVCVDAGLNRNTAAKQISKWSKFNNLNN